MTRKLFVAVTLVLAMAATALPWSADPAAAADTRWVDVAHHDGGTWALSSAGQVVTAGTANNHGDVSTRHLNGAPRAIVPTPSGAGYWIMGADGGIFTFGDAGFYGSTGNMRLNAPVISMAATPNGAGYWLLAADGGIFTFGNAKFHGSTGNMRLNAPVVAMDTTPDGRGYWLLGADGGIFTFGNAKFHGSTGNLRLNAPVISMAATADGRGYWLLGADGGIFTFGNAPFRGATTGRGPATGIARTSDGYVQLLASGTVVQWPGGAEIIAPNGPPSTGPHSFVATGPNGQPARWNPCRTIRVAVNYAGSSRHPDVRTTLPQALDRVRGATGLNVTFVGETTATTPNANADVVISWTTRLPNSVLGEASIGWSQATQYEIRVGTVEFNGNVAVNPGFGGYNSFGILALHEIAHVMGLGHVTSTGEVMYPIILPLAGYGPGDREGLWRVGAPQGCMATAFAASSTAPDDSPLVWTTISG